MDSDIHNRPSVRHDITKSSTRKKCIKLGSILFILAAILTFIAVVFHFFFIKVPQNPHQLTVAKVKEELATYATSENRNEIFTHPEAKGPFDNSLPLTPKMNTAGEFLEAHKPIIEPKNGCGCTNGYGLVAAYCIVVRVDDLERRMAIRETYVSAIKNEPDAVYFFILGRSRNESIQRQVLAESQEYRDIIQFDFLDSYNNLTLKTVAMNFWIATNCPNVKFYVKLDDDSFVRVTPFQKFMRQLEPTAIYGLLSKTETKVVRDPDSKWFLNPRYFPNATYKPYCGGFYIVPGKFASKLVLSLVSDPTTDTIPLIPIEDYAQSILARKAGIQMKHIGVAVLMDTSPSNLDNYLVFFNNQKSKDIREHWKKYGAN